jgi:ATP-dependent Zn protease
VLLKEYSEILKIIADALLEKESLDREHLEKIVTGKGIELRTK